MANVALNAALTADSGVASGLAVFYVLSGHPSAGATVAQNPTVHFPVASAFVGSASVGGSLVSLLTSAMSAGSGFIATALEENLSASFSADSSAASNAWVFYSIAGTASTGASVASNLNSAYALRATLAGTSSVVAYLGQLFSGQVNGVGTTTGGIRVVKRLSGEADGHATLSSPIPQTTQLLSGHVYGFGDFAENILLNFAGTASGQGNLNTPHLTANLFAYGTTSGVARVYDTGPLPIVGVGSLFGFLQIDRLTAPINCPPCPPPPQFRWGHVFSLGDLQVKITDTTGTRFMSPVNVTYTMYQLTKSGVPMQAGPEKRAVMQRNGVFYVVGTAGEGGQPGNWLIRWTYQKTFGGDFTTVNQPFTVVDSISAPIVGDPTCRVIKYGWD